MTSRGVGYELIPRDVMRDFRLTIRARITGGSLLIAILISIAAGILIYNQCKRIVSAGQARVLESIEGQLRPRHHRRATPRR